MIFTMLLSSRSRAVGHAVTLLLLASCRSAGPSPEGAMRLFRQGQYDKALAAYLQLVEEQPSPEYNLQVGRTLSAMDKCEEALPYLSMGRASEAYAQVAIGAEAQCLGRLNRLPSAVSLLQQGVGKYPQARDLTLALAQAHAAEGHTQAAEDLYRRMLSHPRVSPQEIDAAAQFYERKLDDRQQALTLYERYLRVAEPNVPRYAEVRRQRQFLLLTGTFSASDPTGKRISDQAWALMTEGRYAQAAERIAKHPRQNAETWYMQGYCYIRSGDYHQSIPLLEAAVKERPQDTRYQKALTYARRRAEAESTQTP